MQLEREKFEAYLESLPDGREFDYLDINGCLGCSFVKETTSFETASFAGTWWMETKHGPLHDIPKWLECFLRGLGEIRNSSKFTALESKQAYRKLFPELEPTTPMVEEAKVNI